MSEATITDANENTSEGTAKTVTVEATTGEAMRELGKQVAHLTHGGDVILLSGPLGAGKTTFAQGFGAGLNISEPIVSPTFTIARELKGQFPSGNSAHLIHVDATDSAATPTPQAKMPSNDYSMNSNPSDSTKNSKTPATTPSSSWNGENRWQPRSHRNASKSTSTGHSTPLAQTKQAEPTTNSPATAPAP